MKALITNSTPQKWMNLKRTVYKRKGIELSDTSSSENVVSRSSVASDDNEDIQVRTNNSFLHDNVD